MLQEFISNLTQDSYLYLIMYFLFWNFINYVYKIIIIYLVCEVVFNESIP
jgi:hypothetical protein